MRHRFTKRVELPASLRPSMAAAMVFLTEPQPGDTFLDPLCGSGTILLERLYQAPAVAILGGDIEPERVAAARQNLSGVPNNYKKIPVTIRQWDAQRLPLENASVDKIATNLPFGKQIAVQQELGDLYSALFQEMERVVKPGGRIVLLSSEFELVKSCIRPFSHLSITTGYSVSTLGRWGRIHLIERS
jgi:tRNA G10  N-methylase Trm11